LPLPKSNMKINKKGLTYTSNIDQASYTIKELSRAALRDVSRMLRYKMTGKIKKLPGLRRGKRAKNSIGYWLRKREGDLQIGIHANTWYGVQQELGTLNQPQRSFLKGTTMENIAEIVRIESQYLSAIDGDSYASLINEAEGTERDDD